MNESIIKSQELLTDISNKLHILNELNNSNNDHGLTNIYTLYTLNNLNDNLTNLINNLNENIDKLKNNEINQNFLINLMKEKENENFIYRNLFPYYYLLKETQLIIN